MLDSNIIPLRLVDQASEKDLDDPIREVRIVTLYFVAADRNAWHTTWISRFGPTCMHHTIESAKAYCERRRGQGTFFFIEQLPALAVIGADCSLAVTEIYTNKILKRLRLKAFTAAIEGLPRTRMTIGTVVKLLNPESLLWMASEKSSSILVLSNTPNWLTELRRGNRLYSWKSKSTGTQHRLSWIRQSFNPDRSKLRAIADILSDQLETTVHTTRDADHST